MTITKSYWAFLQTTSTSSSLTSPRHQERKKELLVCVGKAVSRFRFLRLTHRAAKVEAILIQSKHGPRLRTSRGRETQAPVPSSLFTSSLLRQNCGLHFHCSAPPKNLHHFLLNASSQLATLPCTTTPPRILDRRQRAGSPAQQHFAPAGPSLHFHTSPTYLYIHSLSTASLSQPNLRGSLETTFPHSAHFALYLSPGRGPELGSRAPTVILRLAPRGQSGQYPPS
ncbi:uncharacterized protein B0T23DRAFT_152548 [Neurospora hispaniola]|uniref:Uncharacterized protein n=1 Tax=Neurospora hispaniola TaxID=588809 RepID=A0AAJ0I8I2_9PEZI|nr:hypothetical protein B0T23DRAFT_152548 [Neurospora hispaniola]